MTTIDMEMGITMALGTSMIRDAVMDVVESGSTDDIRRCVLEVPCNF